MSRPASGKLNANLFFVGVPGLTAASAPTDPNFQTILSKVRTIYAQIGLELGDLTYIDITGADQVSFEILDLIGPDIDLSRMLMLSDHPKARDGAINIFFVDIIDGGVVAGISPGVPGSPIRGTPGSGVAITTGSFPNGLDEIAITMAHETGHWLGLFHTSDPTNLMFPFVNVSAFPPTLTPDQQFVTLRNPVVSQPPQTGAQVSSIRLGSFAIPNTRFVGPITVNVPPAAVSMDLVGVSTFTPATVSVPQDFPTIQLAVNNARALDTIQVGPGRWCGARITKPLNLIGQGGATIVGCAPGNPGPVGSLRKRGFHIDATAAGTSIRNFVFDGNGVTLGGNPLFFGIEAVPGANNLVIDSNTFQGLAWGVFLADGENDQVTHNVFDGFTLTSDSEGGAAIFMYGDTGQIKNNAILYNQFTSTVPAGDFLSWINEADVPVAAIVVSGQDGAVISNNKTSITGNSNADGGVGILATDAVTGFTTPNLTITNNDGRGSAYGLIITNDQNGGTGNTVGAQIRGNFGVDLINGATANIRNRSIQTSLACDPVTGSCP